MVFRFSLRAWRFVSNRTKAAWLFIAGAVWPRTQEWFWTFVEWVLDKAFGDAAFAWLNARADAVMDAAWQDALWSWGPTVLLVGFGLYLLLTGEDCRPPAMGRTDQGDQPRREPSSPRAGVARPPFNTVEDGGQVAFDYSTQNGRVRVGRGERLFVLGFSRASDTSIHLTKSGTNLEWIARVKGVQAGGAIDMWQVERSSDIYTLGLAEVFVARNSAGHVLQGRVDGIADETRGAEKDEVAFTYRIMGDLPSKPETAVIAALV